MGPNGRRREEQIEIMMESEKNPEEKANIYS
jgi:hypothetical protein